MQTSSVDQIISFHTCLCSRHWQPTAHVGCGQRGPQSTSGATNELEIENYSS